MLSNRIAVEVKLVAHPVGITKGASFSPSQSWVVCIMTTAEVHEFFHIREEVSA
jgi:hypothetical protein